MNKSFCPLPFMNFDIESNGELKPCCLFEEPLLDESGEVLNINRISLEQAKANPTLLHIQDAMKNGRSVKGCMQCYKEEDAGAVSKRQREIKNRPNWSTSIQALDIKLGNTCNLKCRICNPRNSSLFNSENKQVDEFYFDNLSDWKWHEKDKLWQQISKHLHSIELLEFMGGEPFLNANHFHILEELIRIDRAKHVELNYVTNGTLYSERGMELFKHFKKVTFVLSADGIGPVFEYNRHPGKWETFAKHLDLYRETPHNLLISYSVSAYSLFGIFDALDYYAERGVHVWFNFVHNANCNIMSLPKSVKMEFERQLELRYKPEWDRIYNDHGLKAVVGFMNQSDTYDSQFESFRFMTKKRDTFRKESVLDIIPELRGHYE